MTEAGPRQHNVTYDSEGSSAASKYPPSRLSRRSRLPSSHLIRADRIWASSPPLLRASPRYLDLVGLRLFLFNQPRGSTKSTMVSDCDHAVRPIEWAELTCTPGFGQSRGGYCICLPGGERPPLLHQGAEMDSGHGPSIRGRGETDAGPRILLGQGRRHHPGRVRARLQATRSEFRLWGP